MRIGILTHPLQSNYGGILQNYALQEVLRRMGHDPITLRTGKTTYKIWVKKIIKNIDNRIKRKNASFPLIPFIYEKRQSGIESFIRQHIKTTEKLFWYSPGLIEKYQLEALCVGSDKSWASYFKHIDDMFFAFSRQFNIIKFSYAPSFGTDKWEFNPEQTEKCRELVKSFTGVSVREHSGVRLCKDYLHTDAKWLLDPTLLLSADDYRSLCTTVKRREDDYILAYILNYTKEKKEYIKKACASLKKKVIVIQAENKVRSTDTVENWISLFRDSAFVITDSFHGTIFSIIFHKDFISLANPKRGSERFKSLSELFCLDDNIHMSIPKEFMPNRIDWTWIDKVILKKQKEALDFIHKSLLVQ